MAVRQLDYPKARLLMEVNTDFEAEYRIKACEKEPWTVAFIEAIPAGSVFWDIGANVGPYSLVAASRGLQVFAVEPGYENYRGLCHNLALNDLLDKVLAVCYAVGAGPGFDWFHYVDLRSGAGNHVLGGPRKRTHHMQQVQIWRIDDLLPVFSSPASHYMKIDVDGSEREVLAGAPAFLRDPRTAGLMIEMQLENEAPIMQTMAGAGWKLASRFAGRHGRNIGLVYGQFARP